MPWYFYIASFFAGVFLANAVPHLVQGVSGNKFPSPFSKPPGKGLSSPVVNVIWALFNILIGYVLFQTGQVSSGNMPSLTVFFIGIAAISIMSSINFQKKDKE
jgi:small-conductance mechanosensitive channel